MSRLRAGVGWATAMLPGMVRELRADVEEPLPVLVSGAGPLADELAAALGAGGEPGLVRRVGLGELEETAGSVLVHVVAGDLGPDDEAMLRAGDRAQLPLVCLAVGFVGRERVLPYVKATDVVHATELDADAVGGVAGRIAARAGDEAHPLARELPILRPHVARRLVSSYAKKNALIGAAVFVPGADMPILTLNQMRMVRRLADAYGVDDQQARLLMLAGVVGAGLGFRALARTALGFVPFALPVRAAVAFSGTHAVGKAAIAKLER